MNWLARRPGPAGWRVVTPSRSTSGPHPHIAIINNRLYYNMIDTVMQCTIL